MSDYDEKIDYINRNINSLSKPEKIHIVQLILDSGLDKSLFQTKKGGIMISYCKIVNSIDDIYEYVADTISKKIEMTRSKLME